MRIETASHLATSDHQHVPHALRACESREPRVMQIEPEDTFEAVLMALHLQSEPTIVLLAEESQAFNDPSHFAQLREICPPSQVSFVIPRSRMSTLARSAHQYDFLFASSLQKAAQLLSSNQQEQADVSQKKHQTESTPDHQHMEVFQQTRASSRDLDATTVAANPTQADREEQEMNEPRTAPIRRSSQPAPPLSTQADLEEQEINGPQTAPIRRSSQPAPPLSRHLALIRAVLKRSHRKRLGLIATLIALFVAAGIVLLPGLFSGSSGLRGIPQSSLPQAVTVGQITFTSSGQLDPTSSKGLNDMVTMSLHNLSAPAPGNSLFAWLLPDPTDDTTLPRLLGKLATTGGKAQLTYTDPNHDDLLASYSGLRVTEQPNTAVLTTPPLDPKTWRYAGSIPTIPTPGDEKQYSLLNHIRHLLAKDPTLQDVGLAGGLGTWLDRNSEKILEWSTAARDSWAGGQQTDLIHRHMIRVLDYLDGGAYVSISGDLPADTPLLVDPQAGRIGLLEVTPAQVLPGYLTHVDIHLQGVMNAPGHTPGQRQLAIKIDPILKEVTTLMQKIHEDVLTLVKMDETQLQSQDALALLNDMVTNATSAYVGQFDSATGGDINGITWIHNELQGLAVIPITTSVADNTIPG